MRVSLQTKQLALQLIQQGLALLIRSLLTLSTPLKGRKNHVVADHSLAKIGASQDTILVAYDVYPNASSHPLFVRAS